MLTLRRLAIVLEESSLTDPEEFFAHLDGRGNSDGLIDLSEWLAGMRSLGVPLSEEKLTRAFAAIDIDSNGSLDRAELLGVLKEVADEQHTLKRLDWCCRQLPSCGPIRNIANTCFKLRTILWSRTLMPV